MKTALLVPGDLIDEATDVQVVLDQQVDNKVTHHIQIGPMLSSQLNSTFLAFPRDDLPEQFIFVGLGMTLSGTGHFDVDEFTAAARDFESWAMAIADSVSVRIRG